MVMDWRQVAPADGQPARALLYRRGAERFVDRVLLAWSRSGAETADAGWRTLVTLPQRWTPPSFPLKADDFVARGVPKGPALGEALRIAEADWIARDFPTEVTAIADAAAARALASFA
jgi:poly(A) polymerase